MSQIAMLLLTNGDEVFGEILNENERGVDMGNALVAQYTMANDVPTILFRKFCTYSNNFDVFFKREHIVATFKDIREDVIKSYQLTMELYNTESISPFSNTDELIGFEPDFDTDDDCDLDSLNDDDLYYLNKKRRTH